MLLPLLMNLGMFNKYAAPVIPPRSWSPPAGGSMAVYGGQGDGYDKELPYSKHKAPGVIKKAAAVVGKFTIEPETVRQKLPFLDEEGFNFNMAKLTIENSNAAFEDFYIFSAVVIALNGVVPDFKKLETPEIPWIWYAVEIIKDLRPDMEFSYEVQQYIKLASNEDGYYIYPREMDELDTKWLDRAEALLDAEPEQYTDATTVEIQAAKLLEINRYVKRKLK